MLKTIHGFPGGVTVKNPPANAGDTGSTPEPGRRPSRRLLSLGACALQQERPLLGGAQAQQQGRHRQKGTGSGGGGKVTQSCPTETRHRQKGTGSGGKSLSRVRLFATPRTIQSLGFQARTLESAAAPFSSGSSQPRVQHCRQILYQLSHKGSPRILGRVVYPFKHE